MTTEEHQIEHKTLKPGLGICGERVSVVTRVYLFDKGIFPTVSLTISTSSVTVDLLLSER